MDDFQKLSDTRYGVAFGELNDKRRTAVAAAVAFTDAMYPFDRVQTDRVCDWAYIRWCVLAKAFISIEYTCSGYGSDGSSGTRSSLQRSILNVNCNCSYTSSMSKRRPSNVLEYVRVLCCRRCVCACICILDIQRIIIIMKNRTLQPIHAHLRRKNASLPVVNQDGLHPCACMSVYVCVCAREAGLMSVCRLSVCVTFCV